MIQWAVHAHYHYDTQSHTHTQQFQQRQALAGVATSRPVPTFTANRQPSNYPRRARSALGVDTVLTLDVCMYVRALERKRLIGMT